MFTGQMLFLMLNQQCQSTESINARVERIFAHAVNVHWAALAGRLHWNVLILVKVDSNADLSKQLTAQSSTTT